MERWERETLDLVFRGGTDKTDRKKRGKMCNGALGHWRPSFVG